MLGDIFCMSTHVKKMLHLWFGGDMKTWRATLRPATFPPVDISGGDILSIDTSFVGK